MSISTCRECKIEISDQANVCPHCGAPYPARHDWNGTGFEWKSQAEYLGYPLVHIAFGRTAENKLRVARGIIAIGQFAIGLITFAQFGIGFLFGFGQFVAGFAVIAQFALSAYFGLGQFAAGYIAIGQMAFGHFVLAQLGYGTHVWASNIHDPAAYEYFKQLLGKVGLSVPRIPLPSHRSR